MIKVKAKIKLFEEGGRKTPFKTGYRPLFEFVKENPTSGSIELIDKELFFPGESGIVIIYFLHKNLLGMDFKEGKRFEFGEGLIMVGEGTVMEIVINE